MTPYSSSIHNFSSEQGNTKMFNIDYSLFSIFLCSLWSEENYRVADICQ